MENVIQALITERKKHSSNPNSVKLIDHVKYIGGFESGQCYANAKAGMAINALGTGNHNIMASGWQVGNWNNTYEGYEIVSHYWNIDGRDYKHYDLSEGEWNAGAYVYDGELLMYAQNAFNNGQTKNLQPLSLLYNEDKWRTYTVIGNEEVVNDIDSLMTANLFA